MRASKLRKVLKAKDFSSLPEPLPKWTCKPQVLFKSIRKLWEIAVQTVRTISSESRVNGRGGEINSS
jgi:hypothetical protein